MAIRIRSIEKIIEDTGIKILVHGPSGSGKTRLTLTMKEPTLIISAESGLLSLKSEMNNIKHLVKGVEVESISDLDEVYEWLITDENKKIFKWVCLDSITEIAERVLANEKANSKDPRRAYMEVQDQMMILLRKFRDLPGYNVLMSAKQQRVSDDTGPTFYAPMMPGSKLHQQIPYIFDEVFALRVEKDENGEDYRVIQTGRDVQYEAKDRSGLLSMFERPDIGKIAKKIHGEKVKPEKISGKDVVKTHAEKLREKVAEAIAEEQAEKSESEGDEDIVIIDDELMDETQQPTKGE